MSRNPLAILILLSALHLVGCAEETATAPSPVGRVVEAGWSFGLCLGPCNGVLELTGDDLSFRITDRTQAELFASARGALTPAGSARLNAALSSLPAELLETYGCPDCADGGASYLVLERDESRRRTTYEFYNPPRELAAVDAFLRSVMDALGDCRSSDDLRIVGACTAAPE